jgi:tripartite-type tricarboxylate transporter receptor subunit TctC
LLAGIVALTGALPGCRASAETVEDFYRGKSVTLIISTGPGDGVDTNGRIVAKHLVDHLPGHPAVVPKNMPGAGHVLASNYLYNEAAKDGTVIATIVGSIITHQLLDGRGVRYNASHFQWIGASDVSNLCVYVWSTTGITSLTDVMTREVLMGATGAGSGTILYPTLMNNLLGTKFKIIAGYQAAKDIDLAMQRGEVEGRAGNYLSSVKALNGDWLRDGKITMLAQIGLEREADFPDLKLLDEFTQSSETRRILQLFGAEVAVGRVFLAPPDLPHDRVAALRDAFVATMRDQAFIDDEAKAGLDVHPLSGEKIEEMVRAVDATSPETVALAKKAIEDPTLPAIAP